VIGADGINSKLRSALGLDVAPVYERFGIRRHYNVRPWTDRVEVHFSNRCEAYVTPVGRELVCIAMLIHDPALKFDQALALFPQLLRRVEGASGRTDPVGCGTVYRRTPSVISGRVALIGDAAGSVDAITGAGITLGLHQVMILSRCFRTGDLAPYDSAYRRLMRLPNGMTSFMLATGRRRWLRRLTLRTLAAAPWACSQILRLNSRVVPTLQERHP
jgi:2-polyprenyl-6-methoxyphenol hydroxylase-like FAD-dependent oxidoreductase